MRDFDRYNKQITNVQVQIEPATGLHKLTLTAPDGAVFGPFYGNTSAEAHDAARAGLAVSNGYTLVA